MLKFIHKNIFYLILLSLPLFAQRSSEWEVLQSPTNDLLRKLFFVDENNGWATGIAGTIIHTKDAGTTWVVQNSNVTTPVVDVYFLNRNLGWALTYPDYPPFGTTLLKTTDGGNNWQLIDTLFPMKFMSCIYFADEKLGWIGGTGIYKTTDGGISWQKCFLDSSGFENYPVYDFNFYNKTFGYACGGRLDVAGVVWRTTNAGQSWSSVALSPDQIFDLYISDSLNAIALSGDPELIYGIAKLTTSDAGVSWQSESLPIYGISFAVDFLDSSLGYSASGFQLLRTINGGQDWFFEPIIDSLTIYDLQFVDKYTGFACGENGTLLKYTSFKKPFDDKIVFQWISNYPNPFTEKTTIEFTVLSGDFDIPTKAKLTLYDILGNKIATIYEDEFFWGMYSFVFSPRAQNLNLSSGVYILTLSSGNVFISRKILYLK